MNKEFYQMEVYTNGGTVAVQRSEKLKDAWTIYEHSKASPRAKLVRLYRVTGKIRYILATCNEGMETLSPEMKELLA